MTSLCELTLTILWHSSVLHTIFGRSCRQCSTNRPDLSFSTHCSCKTVKEHIITFNSRHCTENVTILSQWGAKVFLNTGIPVSGFCDWLTKAKGFYLPSETTSTVSFVMSRAKNQCYGMQTPRKQMWTVNATSSAATQKQIFVFSQ